MAWRYRRHYSACRRSQALFREENRCFIAFQTEVFQVSPTVCQGRGCPSHCPKITTPSCIMYASQQLALLTKMRMQSCMHAHRGRKGGSEGRMFVILQWLLMRTCMHTSQLWILAGPAAQLLKNMLDFSPKAQRSHTFVMLQLDE